MSIERILNGIHRLGKVRFLSRSPKPHNPEDGLIMKRIKKVVDYSRRMYRQEMNVDSNIEATRGTHKVKRIEVIDGKKYLVLDVHS